MNAPADRKSGLASKLMLLSASLVIMLIFVEVSSYLVFRSRVARLHEFEKNKEANKNKPKGRWDHLPALKGLFAVAKPNVRGTTAGVLFETNSHGFRGPERPFEKPEGAFRIAVIGDSVTMGFGVLYEETYAARIEVALSARRRDSGERSLEVINVGLSGLETGEVVERFVAKARPFDPDLVIYGFTLNDIEGDHYRRSYGGRDRNNRRFFEAPLYMGKILGPKILAFLDLVVGPEGSYRYELEDNYFRNPEAWAEVLSGLDHLGRVTQEMGICTLVLIHTRLESLNFLHPYHEFYDAVVEAVAERGFFVAQSYPGFDGREATDLWITPFDAHPNGEGHRLLSEAALDALDALPDRCWAERERGEGEGEEERGGGSRG